MSDLKNIILKNINRISIGQININSIRNKFEFLSEAISGYIDILLITETKLDNSFPNAQFHIKGYSYIKGYPYRLDRNAYGGGILLYIREHIPSKLINETDFDESTEAMFIELNFRKKKCLLRCSYNPHKSEINNHLKAIGRNLDSYSSKYDNYIILGDFNAEPTENAMEEFTKIYNLKNLIKGPTCFKNPN